MRALSLPLLLFLLPGCAGDSGPTKPKESEPPAYGALITPRVSYEADPLLADAYQAITADGYGVAHTAISWAEISVGPVARNWEPLDRHVRRALTSGVKLSVVLEFLHGGEVDFPQYLEFLGWSWEDPSLIWEMARFLREVEQRSHGTIGYLWLGEGPDRYVDRYPELEELVLPFYSVLADTARRIFPDTKLGVLVSLPEVQENGRTGFIRAIRDSIGSIALSVYPQELVGGLPDPDGAVTSIREAIEPWTDASFAIVETGYPSSSESGSSDALQSSFASAIAAWLHERPQTLDLFCWSPIHDTRDDLAQQLAARRYPDDPEARAAFAAILSSASLRRLDGSRKPARELFVGERP